MNYFGSSRRLLANAKAAMLAAIEIYNKPLFEYRNEVFVILLLNSWELLLKAVLSKNRLSIYELKKRGHPYRTINFQEALKRAVDKNVWPSNIEIRPVRENLEQIKIYRDSTVHFYNESDFEIIIYSLAQTSIINFRDVLLEAFDQNLANDIKWRLLPLGTEPPLDPVTYMKGYSSENRETAVGEFLGNLGAVTESLDTARADTSRFMTFYSVAIESIKKIEKADVIVGIDATAGGGEAVYIDRRIDPQTSHPLFMNDVLEKVGKLHGRKFTSYVFQAIVHNHNLRDNPRWFYEDAKRPCTRWSGELPSFIKKLSKSQLEADIDAYKVHLRRKHELRKRQASTS